MQKKIFENGQPHLVGNQKLRKPQMEFFEAVKDWYSQTGEYAREVSVILPTGAGKTGCMAIAPYAVKNQRTLIVVPSLSISDQVYARLSGMATGNFYIDRDILTTEDLPNVISWKAGAVPQITKMQGADIIVTNVHQLMSKTAGLERIPQDFYDLVLFDESHHNVARSWRKIREHFRTSKIINFSATPERTDGKIMHGTIIYAYSISEAIANGYCKNIDCLFIQPENMQVTRNGQQEIQELINHQYEGLGQESAAFRRAVRSEAETVESIIKASLDVLREKRNLTGESRLKIIAAARNMDHCKQLVAAYEKHGVRAGFVHSNQRPEENRLVFAKIEIHELDVVVQVRMLGEGYDHKFFAVAAIFAAFDSFLPFYQFVGRTMRVLKDNEPDHLLNQATIVMHAATNQGKLWDELKEIKTAGRDYYSSLISKVPQSFRDMAEIIRRPNGEGDTFQIHGQNLGQARLDTLVSWKERFERMAQHGKNLGMSEQEIKAFIAASLTDVFGATNGSL